MLCHLVGCSGPHAAGDALVIEGTDDCRSAGPVSRSLDEDTLGVAGRDAQRRADAVKAGAVVWDAKVAAWHGSACRSRRQLCRPCNAFDSGRRCRMSTGKASSMCTSQCRVRRSRARKSASAQHWAVLGCSHRLSARIVSSSLISPSPIFFERTVESVGGGVEKGSMLITGDGQGGFRAVKRRCFTLMR